MRKDGGPRVHPACPATPPGRTSSSSPGRDLRRDGRYSLHTETFAPPRDRRRLRGLGNGGGDNDTATWETVRGQVIEDFGELWPTMNTLTLFELSMASCLLTLTQPGDGFPKGPDDLGGDGNGLAECSCEPNTRRSRSIANSTNRFRRGVDTDAW